MLAIKTTIFTLYIFMFKNYRKFGRYDPHNMDAD